MQLQILPREWFSIGAVDEKIASLPSVLGAALSLTEKVSEFTLGRDITAVASVKDLAPKISLASREGQARLLHDLASIVLQAMELAMRTLCEYPDAPRHFRDELAEICLGEARHLQLCLSRMRSLGVEWGHWPVHLSLWNAVGTSDTLLDRILIVHRYLEGAGLDAGDSILRRLTGTGDCRAARETLEVIVREEVGHVEFGSRWYREVAMSRGIDPEEDFSRRIEAVYQLAPRREKLARELRLKAGFTETELTVLGRCLERSTESRR